MRSPRPSKEGADDGGWRMVGTALPQLADLAAPYCCSPKDAASISAGVQSLICRHVSLILVNFTSLSSTAADDFNAYDLMSK